MDAAGLHAFLRSRRSVRRFKLDLIPAVVLERILEAGTLAPSAHNLQAWRFAVVTTPEAKTRLGQAITAKFRADLSADGAPPEEIDARVERSQRRLNEAPAVIVLCRDVSLVKPQPDETRRQAEATMAVQSVALAGLQIMLAAHAEGLGTVWICWPLFAREATCRALDLPPGWEPLGMLFIGFPAEDPETPARHGLDSIARFL
ncbi:MAG: nitroreductase family protein [Anaerolineales bacterium]|nr:nitroreductase family protein [Anaerolineales bacterium]